MIQNFRIAPSILAADYTRIGEEIAAIEAINADQIHVDVMDGVFVPSINFGPRIVKAVSQITKVPQDVHLMIVNPDNHLDAFIEAGAAKITVHLEGNAHINRTLTHIRQAGIKAGLAISPGTPVNSIVELIPFLDFVLVMSVNPGFGGQQFIPHTFSKIKAVRELLDEHGSSADVSVDGGVDAGNARQCVEMGANVLVVGTAVFRAEGGPAQGVKNIRNVVAGQ